MRLRHVVLILAALFTTAPAISAGEGRQEKTYKTPQEVFDAAKEAAAKDDWKALFGCLTPKTQDMLTGMLVVKSQGLCGGNESAHPGNRPSALALLRRLGPGGVRPELAVGDGPIARLRRDGGWPVPTTVASRQAHLDY